ncbi:MAG: tyrosine--tRNA ligase [Dehalococcoidia bacterium]
MSWDALCARGLVEDVVVAGEFADLIKRRTLRIYQGFDPTSPNLHLGHMVSLRILRWFQLHGHHVTMLLGDFTGRIGDPTDKEATRQQLTHEQVTDNASTYQAQASRFLSFEGDNAADVRFNSEWLDPLSFKEVIEVAATFTVQQMLERDMFQDRLRAHRPIGLHEFLYPLMQGYDSVALRVDVELGGRDQLFNMMVGRQLVRTMQGRVKHVITTPLLPGLDGKKMGKTERNSVHLTEPALAMFAKLTLVDDDLLPLFLSLLTDVPDDDIVRVRARLQSAEVDLRDTRELFAHQLVSQLHGVPAADDALADFRRSQSTRSADENLPTAKVDDQSLSLAEVVVRSGLASSLGDARRVIAQGGVRINGVRQDVANGPIEWLLLDGSLLRVGRRGSVRLLVSGERDSRHADTTSLD